MTTAELCLVKYLGTVLEWQVTVYKSTLRLEALSVIIDLIDPIALILVKMLDMFVAY